MNTGRRRIPTPMGTDPAAQADVKGETGMEKYEPLEMEIICLETEDVITASEDGDTPWGQIGG